MGGFSAISLRPPRLCGDVRCAALDNDTDFVAKRGH